MASVLAAEEMIALGMDSLYPMRGGGRAAGAPKRPPRRKGPAQKFANKPLPPVYRPVKRSKAKKRRSAAVPIFIRGAQNAVNNAMINNSGQTQFGSSQGMGSAMFGNKLISGDSKGLRLKGKAFIGTINSATPSNSVIFTESITPTNWGNSWIAEQAKLWEMYRIVACAYCFIPATVSTLNATFAGYIDTDPRDTVAAGNDRKLLAQTILGNPRSKLFNNTGAAIMMPKASPWLYTGATDGLAENRLTTAGRVTVAQTSTLQNFIGDGVTSTPEVFLVSVLYDIEFRTMNQSVVAVTGGGGGGTPITNTTFSSGAIEGVLPGNGNIAGRDLLTLDIPAGVQYTMITGPGAFSGDATTGIEILHEVVSTRTGLTSGIEFYDNGNASGVGYGKDRFKLLEGLEHSAGSAFRVVYYEAQSEPIQQVFQLGGSNVNESLGGFWYALQATGEVTVTQVKDPDWTWSSNIYLATPFPVLDQSEPEPAVGTTADPWAFMAALKEKPEEDTADLSAFFLEEEEDDSSVS